MIIQLPHFLPCLCNYYMGTKDRYTCVTSNPCLCNSHISDCVSATTTWEPIRDILVWLVIHAYATPTFLTVFCNYYMGTNTNYTCVTSNPLLIQLPHFWPCLCNYYREPRMDILVWLVIHAYATPTFLTVFVQLLHGNQWEFIQDTLVCHLCDF